MDINDNNLAVKITNKLAELQQQLPETLNTFSKLSTIALKEGCLANKTKSILALGLAIIQHSEECILFHLQILKQHDFSTDELLEVIAVVTYMGGGPALMSGTRALDIYHNLNETNT